MSLVNKTFIILKSQITSKSTLWNLFPLIIKNLVTPLSSNSPQLVNWTPVQIPMSKIFLCFAGRTPSSSSTSFLFNKAAYSLASFSS